MLSVQKNEKITRTVPMLKSNSTEFFSFFSMIHIKNFPEGAGRGRVNFFFTYYYIISSM